MNTLTSRQRKLVYAGGILVLLVPIIYLGAPPSEDVIPGTTTRGSGGVLAQMRVEHRIGESTLGQIDPSSAAMNLVLLGFRGPAAGILHMHALDYQKKKNWAKLQTTVDSIIKLQPHYVEIWKFQGWNLSFNVSREWDRVDDRYYWVKRGIKFLMEGTERNETATPLYHDVGDYMSRKIGASDEKKFFRKFFKKDPDEERWNGGPDTDLNDNNPPLDNFQVAAEHFRIANEKETKYPTKTPVIFRQKPSRALFNYAEALHEDGEFSDKSRTAWDQAYNEWTEVYGRETFLGLNDVKYHLNYTEDDLVALAKANGVTLETQRRVAEQNVKMVNFRFWRRLADCERDPEMVKAHRLIFEGKQAYRNAEIYRGAEDVPSVAEQKFFDGMTQLEKVLGKEEYKDLLDHDAYIEEALMAVYYWEKIRELGGVPRVETYPLDDFVNEHKDMGPEIERLFQRENRPTF